MGSRQRNRNRPKIDEESLNALQRNGLDKVSVLDLLSLDDKLKPIAGCKGPSLSEWNGAKGKKNNKILTDALQKRRIHMLEGSRDSDERRLILNNASNYLKDDPVSRFLFWRNYWEKIAGDNGDGSRVWTSCSNKQCERIAPAEDVKIPDRKTEGLEENAIIISDNESSESTSSVISASQLVHGKFRTYADATDDGKITQISATGRGQSDSVTVGTRMAATVASSPQNPQRRKHYICEGCGRVSTRQVTHPFAKTRLIEGERREDFQKRTPRQMIETATKAIIPTYIIEHLLRLDQLGSLFHEKLAKRYALTNLVPNETDKRQWSDQDVLAVGIHEALESAIVAMGPACVAKDLLDLGISKVVSILRSSLVERLTYTAALSRVIKAHDKTVLPASAVEYLVGLDARSLGLIVHSSLSKRHADCCAIVSPKLDLTTEIGEGTSDQDALHRGIVARCSSERVSIPGGNPSLSSVQQSASNSPTSARSNCIVSEQNGGDDLAAFNARAASRSTSGPVLPSLSDEYSRNPSRPPLCENGHPQTWSSADNRNTTGSDTLLDLATPTEGDALAISAFQGKEAERDTIPVSSLKCSDSALPVPKGSICVSDLTSGCQVPYITATYPEQSSITIPGGTRPSTAGPSTVVPPVCLSSSSGESTESGSNTHHPSPRSSRPTISNEGAYTSNGRASPVSSKSATTTNEEHLEVGPLYVSDDVNSYPPLPRNDTPMVTPVSPNLADPDAPSEAGITCSRDKRLEPKRKLSTGSHGNRDNNRLTKVLCVAGVKALADPKSSSLGWCPSQDKERPEPHEENESSLFLRNTAASDLGERDHNPQSVSTPLVELNGFKNLENAEGRECTQLLASEEASVYECNVERDVINGDFNAEAEFLHNQAKLGTEPYPEASTAETSPGCPQEYENQDGDRLTKSPNNSPGTYRYISSQAAIFYLHESKLGLPSAMLQISQDTMHSWLTYFPLESAIETLESFKTEDREWRDFTPVAPDFKDSGESLNLLSKNLDHVSHHALLIRFPDASMSYHLVFFQSIAIGQALAQLPSVEWS